MSNAPAPPARAPRTWTTRAITLDDIPALARLMAEVYGADHRTASERFLRWQYAENPLGEVCGAAAVDGGEIVGAYTLIPIPMRIAGRDAVGMLSLNTATSPRYQGQGIFTAIAKETYLLAERRGAAGVLGFPNENSLPGFVKKLSFDLVGRMACFSRPREVGTLLARGGEAKPAHRVLDLANRAAFRLLRGPAGRNAALDAELVAGLPDSPDFTLAHDAAWYQWRFGRCPLWDYDVVGSPDGRARVIARHDALWGVRTTLLMDFSTDWSSPAGAASLAAAIRAACRRADEEGSAQVMTIVSPGHPAITALWRAGLVRVPDRFLPHPAHVIYRALGGSPAPGYFPAWAVAVGAYDAG